MTKSPKSPCEQSLSERAKFAARTDGVLADAENTAQAEGIEYIELVKTPIFLWPSIHYLAAENDHSDQNLVDPSFMSLLNAFIWKTFYNRIHEFAENLFT